MSTPHLDRNRAVLIVVDVQDRFLASIHHSDRVTLRSSFIAKASKVLEVPMIATEHNPDKFGQLMPALAEVSDRRISKMTFSCAQHEPFLGALRQTGRDQVVLVGVETHICVALTALDLLKLDYELFVCPDACGARTEDRHKLGMECMRDYGVIPMHTEAVAYQWMQTAEHEQFRTILGLVKAAP